MDGTNSTAAAAAAVVVGEVAQELPTSLRIHVGGLGASVTAADIENRFSSLGCVSRVEFIHRSDSRHFAFMDFKPHSEKSLAKLFSTYNGCMWKGGKLKLDKAKEHYMDRLKREWTDDAQSKTEDCLNPNIDDHCEPLELKLKPEEKTCIRLFFPKLKKVKALPFKGTGKHKYSFQRVDVPLLPINFCDCEEHFRPCDSNTKEQSFSNIGTDIVVGDEELNVMNSVMAKLFHRETDKNVVDDDLSKSTNLVKDIPSDAANKGENVNETEREVVEAKDSEDENFVMNIGSKKSDNMMDLLLTKERGKHPTAQDGQKRSPIQHQEKKSRKRQMENDNVAVKSLADGKKIKSASDGHRNWFPDVASGIDGKVGTPIEHLEGSPQQQPSVESEIQENPASNNSGKGSTWVQKSSWRDLVGDTSSSAFSISYVLPRDKAAKLQPRITCKELDGCFPRNAQKSNKGSLESSVSAKRLTIQKKTITSSGQEAQGEDCIRTAKAEAKSINEETLEKAKVSNDDGGEARSTLVPSKQEAKVNTPIRIGEVCTFMRTADSEKQWTKAKTALSSYFKKKSNGDPSPKRVRDGSRMRS